MYCSKCGEENPENAVFCRNCGEKLKEEVKKAEVIETPPSQNNNQHTQTSTESSSKNHSDWLSCCVCLFAVFIIFAIIGSL